MPDDGNIFRDSESVQLESNIFFAGLTFSSINNYINNLSIFPENKRFYSILDSISSTWASRHIFPSQSKVMLSTFMSSLQQPFFRDSEATVTKIMNYGCCCCSCRCYPTFHVGKVAGVQDCCSSSRSNPFFILIIMTAWMLKCVWAAPNQPLYKFIASRSGDCGILCCSVSSCDGFWSSKAAKELVGQQKQPRPGVKHATTTLPAVRMPRASNFLLKMIEEVVVIYLKRTSLAASATLNYISWHAIISYATYAEEEQYG